MSWSLPCSVFPKAANSKSSWSYCSIRAEERKETDRPRVPTQTASHTLVSGASGSYFWGYFPGGSSAHGEEVEGWMYHRALLLLIKGLPWGLACVGGMQPILHSASSAKPGRTQALRGSPEEPTQRWSPCKQAAKRSSVVAGVSGPGGTKVALSVLPCWHQSNQATHFSSHLSVFHPSLSKSAGLLLPATWILFLPYCNWIPPNGVLLKTSLNQNQTVQYL